LSPVLSLVAASIASFANLNNSTAVGFGTAGFFTAGFGTIGGDPPGTHVTPAAATNLFIASCAAHNASALVTVVAITLL
jgi:hypothetical protein